MAFTIFLLLRGKVMTKLAYIGFAATLATITCAAGAGEMGEMKMKDGA